jgi:SAM-dependent methyltransferase
VSDDLVDRLADARRASFESWRQRIMAPRPNDDDPVALAWADTRARFRIPWRYSEQLLDGIARDLTATRYATFEELAAYAYGVASTVGLMAMHIIGYSGAQAIPFQDGSFDLALMLKSLHHVPLDLLDQALAEVHRVLRPQGLLYVSEPVFAGALNEVMRLFHDEELVRAAAKKVSNCSAVGAQLRLPTRWV